MENIIINKTKEILNKMGITADVSFVDQEKKSLANISTSPEDSGFLIGKGGTNLDALEHIIKLAVNKEAKENKINFMIDINDYRQIRTKNLIDTAKAAAERVIQTARSEALEPMNAYERRIVHLELASLKDIATDSIGTDPKRRIVIKPQFTV